MDSINYLVPIQKREILDKVKEHEDYNHRNTLGYFEDYNLSVTQRLFKRTVSGWALFKYCHHYCCGGSLKLPAAFL